jgi:hypothetical protein
LGLQDHLWTGQEVALCSVPDISGAGLRLSDVSASVDAGAGIRGSLRRFLPELFGVQINSGCTVMLLRCFGDCLVASN